MINRVIITELIYLQPCKNTHHMNTSMIAESIWSFLARLDWNHATNRTSFRPQCIASTDKRPQSYTSLLVCLCVFKVRIWSRRHLRSPSLWRPCRRRRASWPSSWAVAGRLAVDRRRYSTRHSRTASEWPHGTPVQTAWRVFESKPFFSFQLEADNSKLKNQLQGLKQRWEA